jgi:fatty-acyl-CoA synthase
VELPEDAQVDEPTTEQRWFATRDNVLAVESIPDILVRAAQLWPEVHGLTVDDSRYTFAELEAAANSVARSLIAAGVRRGEHVGLLMPACLEFYAAYFGALMAGAVVAPLNTRFRGDELAYVIDDADVALVMTTNAFASVLDLPQLLADALPELRTQDSPQLQLERAPRLRRVVVFGRDEHAPFPHTHGADFLERGDSVTEQALTERRMSVRIGGPAMLMYTSGTTSRPKGCLLRHESLSRISRGIAERCSITPADALWDPLPVFHMGGLLPMLAMFRSGARHVSTAVFSPGPSLAQIEREGCTFCFAAFPTIVTDLHAHPDYATTNLDRVRLVLNTAPADQIEYTERVFPRAVVIAPYGLTEICGNTSFGLPEDPPELRHTTCGPPFPGVELRIVDPDTGALQPDEEIGEIQVRSPAMIDGYYKDTVQTPLVFIEGGWFRTGDLGRLVTGGRLEYIARLKDMMRVGGENVAPAEIEAHLATHPAVKLATVAAIPDRRLLEVPAAWVELQPGARVSEDELIEHCRGQMARFKLPRYVRFVEEWPVSATKIQKRTLVEALVAELDLSDRPIPTTTSRKDPA